MREQHIIVEDYGSWKKRKNEDYLLMMALVFLFIIVFAWDFIIKFIIRNIFPIAFAICIVAAMGFSLARRRYQKAAKALFCLAAIFFVLSLPGVQTFFGGILTPQNTPAPTIAPQIGLASPTPVCIQSGENCEPNTPCCSGGCLVNGKCSQMSAESSPSPTPFCVPSGGSCLVEGFVRADPNKPCCPGLQCNYDFGICK